MPSTRPQAAFEPIAPNLDLHKLVESTPNFEWAVRINCDMIDHHGMEQFERLVLVHVVLGGKPLVIDNYDTRLDRWTFGIQWLKDNWASKVVDARDLTADKNVPLTVMHYLKHMALLTNQWDEKNFKDKDRQRMYLKDIDCPKEWATKVRDHIPLGMFYMNESTGDIDGFGAVEELDPDGPGTRKGQGIAKAGDLMSSLPPEMRADNLMCYIGHEGTYTPAHREMCASLGQNIMVEASKATIEDGKLTKPGSSVWFMTETKEREVVSEYWLSRLGHDIEIEKHFAQVNAWKQAPFKVYVVEQKLGDLILIPPLAPHQVWNRGTRTMKVAWNRTTVETLEMAMDEALPKARMVCRDEQYKNKAIIYYTLQKYSDLLRLASGQKRNGVGQHQPDTKVRQLQKDFKRLQNLFTRIMISESFLSDKAEKNVELVPYDSNITCSYCRCNIFNRFLTCGSCVGKLPNGEEDTYDVCMDCYAMGRSCACISKLKWVEQWNWDTLKEKHEQYRRQIIEIEGKIDTKSPKSLKTELNLLGKQRTLAQICQIELTRRPFCNIKKNQQGAGDENSVEREEVDEVDVDGNVKKKKKKVRRSEKYIRENGRCHVDCYWEPKWKQAHCSNCDKNYCYGNLYRAYDMMPQDVMADPDWKCPSCRKICGCRHCRHKTGFKQYTPKGMLLGHNTKAVADPRSVESLVDFSFSNIAWIQKAGDDHEEDTQRLRRRLQEAEVAKATQTQLGEDNYVGGEVETPVNIETQLMQLAEQEGIPIDPALSVMEPMAYPTEFLDIDDEDTFVEHPEGGPQIGSNLSQAFVEPTYMVPEGGIIWDNEHAYDQTDAITYVYPDLNMPVQFPPAPVEGYTPALIPGYEPATQETDGKIEMIDRKRKRGKLDEGDKPYMYKKAWKPKSKTRKSLVIKLAVNKEKLAELSRAMGDPQQISKDVTAPVVGSDLQALNVEHHSSDTQQIPKRVRVQPIEGEEEASEVDDEFTPGRYRYRGRMLPEGVPRPDPDADITRRTTRMQAVTYAEPDENEFNEVVVKAPISSKLATMEKAVQDIDASTSGDEDDQHDSEPIASMEVFDSSETVPSYKAVGQKGTKITERPPTTSNGIVNRPNHGKSVQQPQVVRLSPEDAVEPSTPSSAASLPVATSITAQARANRRAKMAAIEGIDTDSETADQGWSDVDVRLESTSSSDEESPAPVPFKPNTFSQPVHKAVGGKAPRFSLPTTNLVRSSPPVSKPVLSSLSVKKASAADWDDSDSDAAPLPVKKVIPLQARPASSFTAVNANNAHNNHGRGGFAKRGRGRPPRNK